MESVDRGVSGKGCSEVLDTSGKKLNYFIYTMIVRYRVTCYLLKPRFPRGPLDINRVGECSDYQARYSVDNSIVTQSICGVSHDVSLSGEV